MLVKEAEGRVIGIWRFRRADYPEAGHEWIQLHWTLRESPEDVAQVVRDLRQKYEVPAPDDVRIQRMRRWMRDSIFPVGRLGILIAIIACLLGVGAAFVAAGKENLLGTACWFSGWVAFAGLLAAVMIYGGTLFLDPWRGELM